MTTGYRNIALSQPHPNSGSYVYYRETKSWDGANGAKDSLGRMKWNIYSSNITQSWSKPNSGGYASGGDDLPQVPFNANATNDLLNNLIEQIKGHSFNAGVALAEGRETVKLVTDTAGKLFRSVRALKKGRVDLALRELGAPPRHKSLRGKPLVSKDISGQWLEIQYGWYPLVSDVYQATAAYAAIANRPRTFTVRSSKTVSKAYDTKTADKRVSGVSKYTRHLHYTGTESLSTPRELGLQNPASVAWELVPFSFVADWFIPIGTYLENLEQMPQFTGAFRQTDFLKRDTHTVYTGGFYSGASADKHYHAYTRGTLSGPPKVPLPEFKSFDKAMSVGHIKNAVALLHQVFT